MDTFYTTQLEWIQFLHLTRSPLVDGFFRFLNFFDTPNFFFLIIPAIWMGSKHKVGLRFFYIITLNSVINFALKEFFQMPRPNELDPSLGLIELSNYGFPSGGAQTAALLGGLLWYYGKKNWCKWVAANFFFWISLSRIYLGVHFFTDVLGGWVLGFLLLIFFIRNLPHLEKKIQAMPDWTLLVATQIWGVVILILFPHLLSIGAVILGVGWGTFFAQRAKLQLKAPSSSKEAIQRALVGVVGTFVLHKLFLLCIPKKEILMKGGILFILGLWLSFGAIKLWKYLKGKRLC